MLKRILSVALSIGISLFLSPALLAQNSVAVFLFKGSVKIGLPGKTVILKQIGKKLGENDVVEVGANSEVVFSKDGQLSAFSQKGTYRYSNIISRFTPSQKGLTPGIVDFISQGVAEVDENYLKKPEQYLKEAGNVSRAGLRTCMDSLMFMPFNGSLITGDSIKFHTHYLGNSNHEVQLFADGKLVYAKKFSDSAFVVTQSEAKLLPGKKYSWFIKVEDPNNCKRNAFFTSTAEKASQIAKELADIKGNSSGNAIMDVLNLAGYCEKNKLFTEADLIYEGLIKSNNDREDVKQLYIAFLVRMSEPRQAALVK